MNMNPNRDAAAFRVGAEIEHASYERTNRISGTEPADDFLVYVPFTTEQYIRPYSKKVEIRDVVGPVLIREPGREISSVVSIREWENGGYGGKELMYIANGSVNWHRSNPERQNIQLRHSFAADVESDRTYLVSLDLASVELVAAEAGRLEFEAWVVQGSYFMPGDTVTDPDYNIFKAIEMETDPALGGDPYANSGYPYMGQKRDGIGTRKFPFRVRVAVYSGSGYSAARIFNDAAGLGDRADG